MSGDIYRRINALIDQMEGLAKADVARQPHNIIAIDIASKIRAHGITPEMQDEIAAAKRALTTHKEFFLAAHLELIGDEFSKDIYRRNITDRYG